MPMATIVIMLPTTRGPWITGATVVKRDDMGKPTVVRTPSGTIYHAGQFTTVG